MGSKAIVVFPISSFREVHFRKGVGQNALDLARDGFEVTLVSFQNEHTDSISPPHDNLSFKTVGGSELEIYLGIARELLQSNYDLFVIQDDGFRNMILMSFAKILQMKVVIRPDYVVGNYESESAIGRILYRIILFFISHLSDLIVTQTKAASQELACIAPEVRKALYWCPPGLTPDIEQYIRVALENRIQERWKILYVGELSNDKCVSVLISSFNEIKEKYPNWELHIVGDGPMNFSDYDLDRVQFHGFLVGEELAKQYVQAKIFCFPSKSESFSKVLVEAALAETAIISTRVGIADYLLRNAGIFVPKEDAAAMADAISEYIEDEPRRQEDARILKGNSEEFSSHALEERFLEGINEIMSI